MEPDECSRAGSGNLFAHEGADEVAGRNEVNGQLALDEALAPGYVVEFLRAVAELGDEVGLQLPVDEGELVDKDVVDVKALTGRGGLV
ncbi:MAG: hypothetical protein WBW69_18360 [Candidatus Korobacteraceae bacterium]